MLQLWTRISGLLLSALIPVALSQTETATTDTEVCALLDCSLGTYILIGIAVLYSLISIVCVFLICIACSKRREKRSSSKVGPQHAADKELNDVFPEGNPPPLKPIAEATTGDFFMNEHATSSDESDAKPVSDSSSSSDSDESENDTSLVIKNSSAKKLGQLPKKQSPKNVLPRSLLWDHQPRGSPIPPRKVAVPFSVPESEDKPSDHSPYPPGHGPVRLPPIQKKKQGTPRQRRKAAAEEITTPQGYSNTGSPHLSPFHSRKNPQNEIAQDIGKGTPTIKRLEKLGGSVESRSQQKSTTTIDESTLKFEMVKISHKWREVGRAFTLSSTMLNNISIICSNDNDACMLRICEEWLRLQKKRDWSELVKILRSEQIAEKKLADYLQTYYYTVDSAGQAQSNEGNLSFYFKRKGVNSPAVNEDNGEESEGSTWINE